MNPAAARVSYSLRDGKVRDARFVVAAYGPHPAVDLPMICDTVGQLRMMARAMADARRITDVELHCTGETETCPGCRGRGVIPK